MAPPVQGDSASNTVPGVVGNNTSPSSAGDPTTGGRGVVGNSGNGIGVLGQCDGGVGVYGNSGSNVGVYGQSATFQGIYGHGMGTQQAGSAGVVGESDHFDGVFGISHNKDAAGVSGHNPNLGGLAGFFEGDVKVTGDILLTGADCAEQFDIAGEQRLEPGTVVVIDQESAVRESREAYDKKVAGVVSGGGEYRSGIVLDKQQSQENRLPVALVGKVYCKVDAQYFPIEVGDLLTSSPTPGHAMKADDQLRAFGAVIGKALRSVEEGQRLIPILVALQ